MPPPEAVVYEDDDGLLSTQWSLGPRRQDLFQRRGVAFTPLDKLELVGTSARWPRGVLTKRRLGQPGQAKALIEEFDDLVVAELEHGVEAMVGAGRCSARYR